MAQPCFHHHTEAQSSFTSRDFAAPPPAYDDHVLPSVEEITKELPGAVLAIGPATATAGLKSTTIGPIQSHGNLNYIVVLDRPVREARIWGEWKGTKSLLTDFSDGGRPKQNYLVWHLAPKEKAETFSIELRGVPEDESVKWSLYTLSATASVGKKSAAWGGSTKNPVPLSAMGLLTHTFGMQ